MNSSFCVVVIVSFFAATNGQCPTELGNSPLSSCEGMTKHGQAVNVDFYKINRPCTCILTPLFDGGLIITSREIINYACYTEVRVQNSFIFGCPNNVISALRLNVTINQTVAVQARYVSLFASGTFHHCISFQQNGGLNGNLTVICGSPLALETTNEISTTTSPFTTQSSSTSSMVLSVEPTTAVNILNANITSSTITTAAILSEEQMRGNQFDLKCITETLVSLQISLAVFVVISTISTILNIYFFIKIRIRNKSTTIKENKDAIINRRTGNEPNAGNYTELGNTVSGESENQYESIARQDNFVNTNIS